MWNEHAANRFQNERLHHVQILQLEDQTTRLPQKGENETSRFTEKILLGLTTPLPARKPIQWKLFLSNWIWLRVSGGISATRSSTTNSRYHRCSYQHQQLVNRRQINKKNTCEFSSRYVLVITTVKLKVETCWNIFRNSLPTTHLKV